LVGQYEPIELFCLWTKIHHFFHPTWKGLWLIKFFSDVRYVDLFIPEIFVIKVEGCQKSRRNLDVLLALANFWRRAFQKLYARYHLCLSARRLEKFREDIPTSSEVIEAHTLNFRPDF